MKRKLILFFLMTASAIAFSQTNTSNCTQLNINGSFTSGSSNWIYRGDGMKEPTDANLVEGRLPGTKSAQISSYRGCYQSLWTPFRMYKGQTYEIEFWVKSNYNAKHVGVAHVSVYGINAAGFTSTKAYTDQGIMTMFNSNNTGTQNRQFALKQNSNEWQKVYVTFTPKEDVIYLDIHPYCEAELTFTIWITDFRIYPLPYMHDDISSCRQIPAMIPLDIHYGKKWLWSNGSTSQVVSVSPSTTTKYTVTATTCLNETVVKSQSIIINPIPSIVLSKSPMNCLGERVTVSSVVTPSTENYSYSWNTGSTASSINVIPSSTKETYNLTVRTSNGCGNQASIEVNQYTPPTVSTQTVSNISTSTVNISGAISGFGSSNIHQHGFVWSTSNNPTINVSTKTSKGARTTTGTFTETIAGLTPFTTYYLRAYASNSTCTTYGAEVVFTTKEILPMVSTNAASATSASATVTKLGSPQIIQHGVVWSTSTSPTISLSSKTCLGTRTSTGSYSSNISGVLPNTKYYIRAYATSPAGTVYGNELTFTTPPCSSPSFSYNTPIEYTLGSPVYSSSNPVEIAPSLSCFQPEQLFNTYIVESNFPGPFLNPYRMVIDQQGNFYVSEFTYHSIKKVTPNGVISTFAGNTSRGYVDGVGTAAQFDYILSMAIDSKGNIYVSDIKSVIRKVTPGGVVTTYAGNGKTGGDDGLAQDATFQMIEGLAVDASGNVYASEPSSGKIRKITPTGIVTTLVSTGLSKPIGLAVNGTYLYVCDQGTHQIKRVSLSSGAVSVYAGTGQKRDGSTHSYVRQANLATFSEPTEITFDKNGNLFVIERNTRYIYKISPTGIVKLGLNQQPIPFKSYISDKQGIALGPDGYIYTTELNGGGITKLSTYSIDKPLPQGLVFDYTTGIIRGTPTAPSPATEYTVYSCDNNKIYSTKITIAVKSLKKSSEEIFTNNEATNIEDNSFEEEENQVIVLEVYPNPARAERTINIGVKGLSRHDLNSSSLKIYSQMGTEVLSLNDLEDENQVRLPASGMYVAQLLSNKGTIVKTILLID